MPVTDPRTPLDPIEVYDTDSGMGGSFTVSITETIGDRVRCRVWYGRPTVDGWHAWKDWDGHTFWTERAKLRNQRQMPRRVAPS